MTEQEKKQQTIQWIVTGILLLAGLYNQLAIIKEWPHIELVDSQVTQYVTWFYELVMGLITFWYNQNITTDSKISQSVLNALKDNSITPTQVEDLLNNDTVKMVIDSKVDPELIETFLVDKDIQEVVKAHIEGKEVSINIEDE